MQLVKMRKLEPFESPLVNRTLEKKKFVRGTRTALLWGGINFLLALLMYIEISYGSVLSYFNIIHPLIWYAECGLAIVFSINAAVDVLRYLVPTMWYSAVELTPNYRRLLGIRESEPGFRDYAPRVYPGGQRAANTSRGSGHNLILSPSSFTSSRSTVSAMSTPHSYSRSMAGLSPHSSLAYPGSLSFCGSQSSGHRTPSPIRGSPGRYSGQHSASYLGTPGSAGASLMGSSSFHGSGGHLGVDSYGNPMSKSFSMSANASSMSSVFQDSGPDTSGLRSRLHNASVRSSSLREEDCISDLDALDQMMKEQRGKEQRMQAASPDASLSGGASFWNYNRSMSDYSPMLRKYQYQAACRSPQQTKSKDDDTDEPATYTADEIWTVRNIQLNDLERWVENLRKWLGQTIMARLLLQITKVNETLARIGSEDLQIGEVSISTLKQLAVTKATHVPNLNTLIPFLEIATNQEYLVNRLKELGTGGCVREFKWNGGGEHKGKAWGEHLPTDAMIVMHAFCSYMDSRLPPHPKYPDGKTFTSQHFLKTPDKPNLAKKDSMLIYQSRINAPHYKVVIEDDIWSPQKGRNNMFHAILLFLYHVKTKERGMLGRVNLGMSGVNVLWVLES